MQIQNPHSEPNSHYSQFGQLKNKPVHFEGRGGGLGISCARWIETGQLFDDTQQANETNDFLKPDELLQRKQSVGYVGTLPDGLIKELDNIIYQTLQPAGDDHWYFRDGQQTSILPQGCQHALQSPAFQEGLNFSYLETWSHQFNELNFIADRYLVDRMLKFPGAHVIPQLEVIASFKHDPLLLAGAESARVSSDFIVFSDQMRSDIADLKDAISKDPDVLDAFRGVLFYSLEKIFNDAGATLEALHKGSTDPVLRAHFYHLAHAANSLPVQEALARLDMNNLPKVFGVLDVENFEDATSCNDVIGCLFFKSAKNAQYIRLCHEAGPKISGQRVAIDTKSPYSTQRSNKLMGRLTQKHIDLIVYGIKSKLTASQLRQFINQLIEEGHMLPDLKQ